MLSGRVHHAVEPPEVLGAVLAIEQHVLRPVARRTETRKRNAFGLERSKTGVVAGIVAIFQRTQKTVEIVHADAAPGLSVLDQRGVGDGADPQFLSRFDWLAPNQLQLVHAGLHAPRNLWVLRDHILVLAQIVLQVVNLPRAAHRA